MRYSTVPGQRSTAVVANEVDGGELRRSRTIDGRWIVPAVTLSGEPSGLSANGETLVLVRPIYGLGADETEFLVLDAERLRVRDRVAIDGFVSFDAISPDGETMYVVRYEDPRRPLDYDVRAFDLAAGELVPGEIVDPEEPGEQMGGQPVDREMSLDGRWAYTLYGGGHEAFIHAIDTEGGTAKCIDLEEFTPDEAFRLNLDVLSPTGAIAVTKRGNTVAEVDPETFDVTPASDEPAAADPTDDGAGALPWVAAAAGVLIAGLGVFLLGHGRRRRNEAQLGEIFAASGTEGTEPAEEPERERVQVP